MKTFKKVLASALAAAMVVTAFPVTNAEAASTAKLNATKATLYAGQSKTLKVTTPKTWKNVKVTATSSKKSVATAKKSGKKVTVKAVKAGTAKVTVKVTAKKSGKKVSKTLKATITVKTPSVKFTDSVNEIKVGETATVKAKATPSSAKVTYSSSDKNVATVDAKGVVTAVSAGAVKISAKIKTGTKTTTKSKEIKVVDWVAAKQTGAKKITVTSSKDLKDAKISVKKGVNAVNATTEVNGKEAVLTLSANIAADKYIVTVDDKDIEVTGEASKISTIEIADVAIADQALPTTTTTGTAVVSYQVKNQFDEDLSKTTTVNVSSSMPATASQGKVTLTLPNLTKEGDLATVVLVEGTTGVNASKAVKISAQATVADITLTGIYNKDGKELTEGTVNANTFYMVAELKDQYGKAIDNAATAKAQTIVTNAPGLTNVQFGDFTQITVGADKKLALPVSATAIKSGTGSVLVIAKNTGKNAQASYTVKDAVKVDTFSTSPKDDVIGGQTAEFDFTAVDTYGKEIADPTADMFSSVPAGFAFSKDAKTGKTVLKYTAANVTTDTPVVVNFITKTNKVVTVSFTVKKNSYPVAISKIKDFNAGVLNDKTKLIKISDVVFEDQYGREMSAEDAIKTINGVAYTLQVSAPATVDHATIKFGTVSGSALTSDSTLTTASLTKTDGITVTPSANSSNALKFELKAGNDVKDAKEYTVVSKGINDIATFAVKDIALVNGNVDQNVETAITVTGTTSDGTVVDITDDQYSVYGQLATSAGVAKTISGKKLYADNKEAVSVKEGSFDVVIANDKGTTISKTVKVSNEASKVAVVKIANKNEIVNATSKAATNDELRALIKAEDQYGATISVGSPRITVKNVDTNLVATGNGTANAAISKAPAKAYVELSYVFDSGVKFDTSATLAK